MAQIKPWLSQVLYTYWFLSRENPKLSFGMVNERRQEMTVFGTRDGVSAGPQWLSIVLTRIKSGIFGQTAKFGQRPCLFHISNIGIKIKLTKQTVKILMRRLIRSRLIWIYIVCKCVSEFTWCPNSPDITLFAGVEYNHGIAQRNWLDYADA